MKTLSRFLLVLIANIIFVLSAQAFNTSFMKYSPVFYFNDQDWSIQKKATMDALNHAKDNAKVTWKNPQSSAFGYLVPFNTTSKNNRLCRQLKIFNSARQVTGEATYLFCKVNGEWKIVS